jgi:hypothetical protein
MGEILGILVTVAILSRFDLIIYGVARLLLTVR